ncbi:hypothetical protein D9M72_637260 [compost metagenome]
MFEKSADDGLDTNIVGKARNLRSQAADAAHHQVDFDACTTGLVEGIDDVGVDERVHLHPDRRRPPRLGVLDLLLDMLEDARA